MFDGGAERGRGWVWSRRRGAVNEALHELRRPLQALALAPAVRRGEGGELGSLRMATEALERLDRAVNGGPEPSPRREPLRVRPLFDEVLIRWGPRAELGGGSLALRWWAGDPVLIGDRAGLCRALDNLLANALEHGGPHIVVTIAVADGALRTVVADSGRPRDRDGRRAGWRDRRRHGHGLRIVRRVAAAHGGSFELRRTAAGAAATLELPLRVGEEGS